MKRTIPFLLPCLLILSACLPASPTVAPLGAIQTAVALTLAAEPTLTPVPAAPTEIPPAATAIPATPTLALPTLTPQPLPTQTSAPAVQSPEQFIRYYYDHINISDYALTWSLLSERFKNRLNSPAQGGYQGYVDFWDTVHRVEITRVEVVGQTGITAELIVSANYYFKNGTVTSTRDTFHLVFNIPRSTWLFDSP